VPPISAKLAGILELARADPTGKRFGPEAFVFGDVIGPTVPERKVETGGRKSLLGAAVLRDAAAAAFARRASQPKEAAALRVRVE
jgi:hypothetical protein